MSLLDPRGILSLNCGVGHLNARGFVTVTASSRDTSQAVRSSRQGLQRLDIIGVTHQADHIHSAKQAIAMFAHIEDNKPGRTEIAAEYNSLKSLIDLVTAKLLTINLKIGFGIVTCLGDTAPRPAGTSLPNFFDDITVAGTVPSVAELTTSFIAAETAAGITHTPNTNNLFKLVYSAGVGGGGHTNYREFCGLNPNGSDDPSEAGVFGQGNILPGVLSQWLNSSSETKTSTIDWLQRSMNSLAEILIVAGFNASGVDAVNRPKLTIDTLPPPGDITVVTGSNPGEIDVSWTDADSFYARATDAIFQVWVGKTEQQVIDKDFSFTGGTRIASGEVVEFLKPGVTYYIGVTTGGVGSPGGKDISDYLVNWTLFPGIMSTIKTAVAGA